MAALWWSNGDPDRLLGLKQHQDALEEAVRMVSDSGPGRAAGDKIASLIQHFLTDLGPDHRELLISQLARVFSSYQRHDLAEHLGPAG